MKSRWNSDVLRGLLLAYALHSLWEGIGAFRLGIAPYQPIQFWIGLGFIAVFAAGTVAFLRPTPPRLQATFILFATLASASLLWLLWVGRQRAEHGLSLPLSVSVCFGQAMNIAAATGVWLLYRAESKSATP